MLQKSDCKLYFKYTNKGVIKMRSIEKEMIAAIQSKQNWIKSNTYITYNDKTDMTSVYLFSNHIGDYSHNQEKFITDLHTLENWPTPTTKSRLRALGVNLTQNKGKVYIDNIFVCNGE